MTRTGRKGLIAVALVAVLAGVLAGWWWAQSISTAQNEEREDLDLFLDASSAGWAEATNQFFLVPEVTAQTVGALSPQMETAEEQLVLLAETIRQRPNIDSAYIGYPDGSFFFVARSNEVVPGGFRTRVIDFDDAGSRQVELAWTDEALQVVESELTPDDTYDPRERLWYQPISDGLERNWTAPYVFASSELPGITHSRAVVDSSGELVSVVGIDIRLSRVNEFLEVLSPGSNGTALVVDDAGQIIAESSMDIDDLAPAEGLDGVVRLSQSSELRGLIDDFAVADVDTLRERSLDRSLTTVIRPAGAREEWYLAVRALDDDFLNDDAASNAFEIFAVAVTVAAAIATILLSARRYLSGLKNDAEIDVLTGAFNRRAVNRQLLALLDRTKEPVHVAIVDLDNFKEVNDQNGHGAGDAILIAASNRMRQFGDVFDLTVGRLGGDEFVMFGDGHAPDWAVLTRALAKPVAIDGRELAVSASVGVTDTETAEGREIEDLLRSADRALFDVKRQGGDGFRISNETQNSKS